MLILMGTTIEIVHTNTTNPMYFRLLAVEALSKYNISGQHLIEELLSFPNWNNSTDSVSHIHLLSRHSKDEVSDITKPFWKGNSTKENVKNQIQGFLAEAVPGEITVFYFIGHGGGSTLHCTGTNNVIRSAELISWLSTGGLTLATVICIIDTCGAGDWINDGEGGELGENRLVLCGCRSYQLGRSTYYPDLDEGVSDFLGFREVRYPSNLSKLPLGMIGGMYAGEDENEDGWISFLEAFEFAKHSVPEFKSASVQNPVAYNGLGFDPPLVLLPVTHDVAVTNVNPYRTILGNATTTSINVTVENQGNTTETFNVDLYYDSIQIGNKKVTLTSEGTTTLIFDWTTPNILGNYTIFANASQVSGETETDDNTLTCLIQISITGDINSDGTVNILDVASVAKAYNSRPGDPEWDNNFDVNEDRAINILDIATVAKEYGKSL